MPLVMDEMKSQSKLPTKVNGWARIALETSTYSLPTIYAAAYVFLDRVYVYLDKESKKEITVWLYPKNKKDSLDRIGLDFYNELINYGHYFNTLKDNAEAIKVLMQRALFSAAPSLIKDITSKEVENACKKLGKPKKLAK